jgi:hypothetical protein
VAVDVIHFPVGWHNKLVQFPLLGAHGRLHYFQDRNHFSSDLTHVYSNFKVSPGLSARTGVGGYIGKVGGQQSSSLKNCR